MRWMGASVGVISLAAVLGCGASGAKVADAGSADAGTDAGPVVSSCGTGPLVWTEKTGPDSPPGLWHAAMAPDLDTGEVLLFGGETESAQSDEAWTWNGATGAWTNRTPTPRPASWPSARSDESLTWDPVRHTIVMFGGLLADLSQTDELWEWDGTAGTWTNLTPANRPASWPEHRYSQMAAYDVARGRLLLFGGIGPPSWPGYAGDLWEWNSAFATWLQLTPDPLPAAWPAPRQSAGMVYDPSTQKTVLFGGWDNLPNNDTWEWDGAARVWVDRTPAVLPAAWPPAGEWNSLVLDVCRGQPVLVGGDGLVQDNTGLGSVAPELWGWSSAGGTWVDLAPSPLPADWPVPREVPAAAWDPGSRQILFFGGQPFGASPLADTWTWGSDP
ncbi:MAG TPA: kelch repeat-containing protein [Polyangia bacterium]|nr:kelch repeat-containing protein [Polyangia bacterium]